MDRTTSPFPTNNDTPKTPSDKSTSLTTSYRATYSDAFTQTSSHSTEEGSSGETSLASSPRYLLCNDSYTCPVQSQQDPNTYMARPRILVDLSRGLDQMRPDGLISSLDLNAPLPRRESAGDSSGDTREDSPSTRPRMPDIKSYVESYTKIYGIQHRSEDFEEEEMGLGWLCPFLWSSLPTRLFSKTQSKNPPEDTQPEQSVSTTGMEPSGRLAPGYFMVNKVVYMPKNPSEDDFGVPHQA
ncbi:hypothetical protein NW762_008637 [Fusarium torreyae]|uniref:Uncharacterized protein n=1 Tax=Fusarium torreyae TaxID=1237075 RepID=A0A9W8RYN3_9HYPO|nr:hypothetical protein NW762_008637 [Fusarium torreyae]